MELVMQSYFVDKFVITTKPKSGKRIFWIDFLKGIGIILVVFGHTQVPRSAYLYSFHMPLFFFISGFLFRGDPSTKFQDFTKKRIISLVVPYFFFSIVSFSFYLIFEYLRGNSEFVLIQLNRLVEIFYGNANNGGNDSLWFLSCLFITAIIYYIFDKYSKNNIQLILFLICSSIISYLYSIYISFDLPWKANVAFSAVVFYGAGHLFHKHFNDLNIIEKFHKPSILIILLGTILLHILVAITNVKLSNIKRVNMVDQIYGNFILFYIAAFLGIFIFIILVLFIKRCKIIELVGQSSLLLLATHKLVFYLIPESLITYFSSPHYLIELSGLIVFTAIAIAVNIPIIFLFNKFLPILIGKKMIRPLKIIIDFNMDLDEQNEISITPKDAHST